MPQHKQEIVLARRHQVGLLYLQGRYQAEIAQILGCSQQQVSADLAVLRRLWLASSLRDFDAAKAEELEKIDHAERAYWLGWERSQKTRTIIQAEHTTGEHFGRKRSRRREGQVGDPRFLDGVLRCIAQRCDILGLSTATETNREVGKGLSGLLAQARQDMSLRAVAPIAEA